MLDVNAVPGQGFLGVRTALLSPHTERRIYPAAQVRLGGLPDKSGVPVVVSGNARRIRSWWPRFSRRDLQPYARRPSVVTLSLISFVVPAQGPNRGSRQLI